MFIVRNSTFTKGEDSAGKRSLSPPVAFAADRSKAVVGCCSFSVLFVDCLQVCCVCRLVFSNGLVTPCGEERADFSIL